MTPGASIGAGLTATGDVIVGPGGVTTMIKGLPVACLGDAVMGPMMMPGVITMTTAPTVIAKGRPQANLCSPVTGVTPPMPVPLPSVSVVAITPFATNIV